MDDDARWTAWCADYDAVFEEMVTLFHTRWMWRAITGLMNNGVPGEQYTVVQNYFVRTYVGTVCTAIRREADLDSRTSSLARCLHALIDCPHFASRARYVKLAREELAADGYDSQRTRSTSASTPSHPAATRTSTRPSSRRCSPA